MNIRSLGYVGIRAEDPQQWVALSDRLLGLQVASATPDQVLFRMDQRRQRITVVRGEGGGIAFLGWELADASALGELRKALDAAGVAWTPGSTALAQQRGVTELICFADPDGNRLEAYRGALDADTPFVPARTISGFVTGSLGAGHVALTVTDIGPMLAFYRDVLKFRVSDWVTRPFQGYFFHVNPRHHSLAMLATGKQGVHHLMLELLNLDDVGQGYDRAQMESGRLSVTLGRHTNDYMTSFYINTPSNFLLEYGWGGRNIETGTWQPRELTEGPSLWGHERSWLPPEGRQQALQMRLKAADDGTRAPVQVLPGNHRLSNPAG